MTAFRMLALAGLATLVTNGVFAEEGKRPKLDANGDGALSAEELAKAPEKIQAKLKTYDKDGDGALSKEEYEAARGDMKKGREGGEKKEDK